MDSCSQLFPIYCKGSGFVERKLMLYHTYHQGKGMSLNWCQWLDGRHYCLWELNLIHGLLMILKTGKFYPHSGSNEIRERDNAHSFQNYPIPLNQYLLEIAGSKNSHVNNIYFDTFLSYAICSKGRRLWNRTGNKWNSNRNWNEDTWKRSNIGIWEQFIIFQMVESVLT